MNIGSTSNNGQAPESNLDALESYVEQTTRTNLQVVNWVHTCPYCSRSFTTPQALGGHQNAHRNERLLLRQRSRRPWPYPLSTFPQSTRQVIQPSSTPSPMFEPWFGYGAPVGNVLGPMLGNGFIPNLMYGSGPGFGVAGLPVQSPVAYYYYPPYTTAVEPTRQVPHEENVLGDQMNPTNQPSVPGCSRRSSESTDTDPSIRVLVRNENDVEVDGLDLTLRL